MENIVNKPFLLLLKDIKNKYNQNFYDFSVKMFRLTLFTKYVIIFV